MANFPRRPPPERDPNAPPLLTRRGEHPDLREEGDDAPRASSADEEFDARWRNDPAFKDRVMQGVAYRQERLPPHIQQWVAGATFGSTPSEGLREYSRWVDNTLAAERFIRTDSPRYRSMSPEELDQLQASGWQVVDVHAEPLSDAIDRFSANEWQHAAWRRNQGQEP